MSTFYTRLILDVEALPRESSLSQSYTAKDGLPRYGVVAIASDTQGDLWFGTDGSGVCKYDGKSFQNFTTAEGLGNNRISDILQTRSGDMWFVTWGGVSRYHDGEFQNFTSKEGLAHNWVLCLTEDREGNLWFGTWGGLSRYDESVENIPANMMEGMLDTRGNLWFRSPGIGLGRYNGKNIQTFAMEDGLSSDYVSTSIHEDSRRNIWFAMYRGLAKYDGKEFHALTKQDGLPSSSVNAVYEDSEGLLWLGTQGVCTYDGQEFIQVAGKKELGQGWIWVSYIIEDRRGNMWFSMPGHGVCRYDGKKFTRFTTKNGLADSSSFFLLEDRKGNIWIATEGGGLCRYDGETFRSYTTLDGLIGNVITHISEDSQGNLWFAVAAGGIHKFDGMNFQIFTTDDGLLSNAAYFVQQDEAGNMIFATTSGISIYTPPRDKIPPPIVVTEVVADKIYPAPERLRIPSTTPRISFSYYGMSFKTKRMRYNYMLEGHDADWQATWDEEVSYEDLELGNYAFKVIAIDRDLNYSEPATVELEVIPDPRNHQIAQLEGELAERERAEMERMRQELEEARQIQQSLLPKAPPQMAGFEIAGTSISAKEVSGDFYNYLSLGQDVGVMLADVTGKSVRAAMVAALADGMLDAEIKGQRELWDSPSKILAELNIGLQPRLIRGMFTAMLLGIIRAHEKKLLFSNAGMPYPIAKRGKEAWELEVIGMPLGIIGGAEYQDLSFDLEKGDLVVFYSDGVIEAENEAEEMYQTERLLELVQEASSALSAQEMVDLIVGDVTAFVGDEEASDDITIVVLRCKE